MTKMISNEKIINYKVSQLFEIYNFHFSSFFKRGHLKCSKIQFQSISTGNMIFSGGSLGEPPVEIHDFYRQIS